DLHLYGGREVDARVQTPSGFTELGVDTIAPFVTRGVLLDAGRHRGVERIEAGRPSNRNDLEAIAQNQGVAVGEGDVVLVRTGNGALWQDPKAYLQGVGMTADASLWVAGQRVRAVGADNMAWDEPGVVDTDLKVTLPGSVIVLIGRGV